MEPEGSLSHSQASATFPVETIIIPCSYCAPFVPPDLLHTHYI